ncbi:MAG: hypothetical protein WD423_03845 [Rhodothermales bacterium]
MRHATGILTLIVLLAGCATTELPELTDDELPNDEPFVGANVILIEMDGDSEAIRSRVVQTIRIEGTDIAQPSLDEPTIGTEPVTFSGVNGSARYFVDIPENEGDPVRMYGILIEETVSDRNSFARYPTYRVVPGGSRQSITWQTWTAMNDLANIMAQGDILYDRE